VGLASGTAPEDFGGTMLRLLAYMAGLAVLGVLGVIFFRLPDVVAAVAPAPRPQWIEVERPHPAFELVMPELGGPASRYAIFRREADGARKDVLSWGEAASSGPYVMLEVYRPGAPSDRFIDPASEIAARLIALTVTDDVKPAGVIDGKFGAMSLVDFAIAPNGRERRCLGFARAFDDPSMQIAGWYCSASTQVVDRALLACALDRLTILSAAGDSRVADLFARAEIKRSFCGRRNPILAATPEGRKRAPEPRFVKLRGHRLQ
jgi:hypothetical protein